MIVTVYPGKAAGTVAAPPSKSMAHRLLLAAGLAQGQSTVRRLSLSDDIAATIDCLRALGATVELENNTATVTGTRVADAPAGVRLACRESGSTLRFFLPLCLLSARPRLLTGSPRLLERPLTVYETLCRQNGLGWERQHNAVAVQGPLQGGRYVLPGDVSSQFVTGLLYALPLTGQDSTLTLTGKIESRSYIDLTLQALSRFGVNARFADERTLLVPASAYRPADVTVEGDHSNAAFWEALNFLGGAVRITGLANDSLQGDRVCRSMFAALSAGAPTLSLADCPDLGPVLMVVAAAHNGCVLTDTARLRIKESDRGAVMARELEKFGVTVTVEDDRIFVPGGRLQPPHAALDGHNDHRVVMALATLCTVTGGVIRGIEAVRKSYPDFFQQLSSLGITWKEEAPCN